jgi:hypothetical protein
MSTKKTLREDRARPTAEERAAPPWRQWGRWAGSGLGFLFGLCVFVPWMPLVVTFYYEYCMHVAFEKGAQFGTDVMATYGPLGFIGLPLYRPSTFPTMIATNVCLYALMLVLLWRFGRRVLRAGSPPLSWMALVVLPFCLGPAPEWAPVLSLPFVLAVMFVVNQYFAESPPPVLGSLLWAGLLGPFLLVKGSFIALLCLAIFVVALDRSLKWHQVPWLLFAFGGAIGAGWVVSGQKVANLIPYFWNSLDLMTGYKHGMSVGNQNSWQGLPVAFAVVGMGLVGSFVWVSYPRLGWRTLGPASVLAGSVFIVFQHGFVRTDASHTVAACLTVFSLCALLLPFLWKLAAGRKFTRPVLVANACSVVGLMVLCGLAGGGAPTLTHAVNRAKGLPQLLAHGTTPIQTAMALHHQELKEQLPLPKLKEPFDGTAVDIGLAEAHGLTGSIRPTITVYQANTPRLSHRNREYLENPSGPATLLLLGMGSIDGRLPSLTDSLGILAQKTHFQAVGAVGHSLILERRVHPLKAQFQKLHELTVGFDELIPVPDPGNDALFVQVFIEPTLWGRAYGFAYKPPETYIRVMVGQQSAAFRLIGPMAEEGMIVSPLLYDQWSFAAFYGMPSPAPAVKISAFRLECEKGREWSYRRQIKVVVSKLVVE